MCVSEYVRKFETPYTHTLTYLSYHTQFRPEPRAVGLNSAHSLPSNIKPISFTKSWESAYLIN